MYDVGFKKDARFFSLGITPRDVDVTSHCFGKLYSTAAMRSNGEVEKVIPLRSRKTTLSINFRAHDSWYHPESGPTTYGDYSDPIRLVVGHDARFNVPVGRMRDDGTASVLVKTRLLVTHVLLCCIEHSSLIIYGRGFDRLTPLYENLFFPRCFPEVVNSLHASRSYFDYRVRDEGVLEYFCTDCAIVNGYVEDWDGSTNQEGERYDESDTQQTGNP